MLPQFRKWILVNNSGQLLTYNGDPGGRINLKQTAYSISPSTGLIAYTQITDDDLGFVGGSSLANGAEIVGDIEYDNTINKYIGLQVQLEVTHDEGAAIVAGGVFDLYIDGGDATGELSSDSTGYGSAEASALQLIGSMVCDPNVADDEVIRSAVWEL